MTTLLDPIKLALPLVALCAGPALGQTAPERDLSAEAAELAARILAAPSGEERVAAGVEAMTELVFEEHSAESLAALTDAALRALKKGGPNQRWNTPEVRYLVEEDLEELDTDLLAKCVVLRLQGDPDWKELGAVRHEVTRWRSWMLGVLDRLADDPAASTARRAERLEDLIERLDETTEFLADTELAFAQGLDHAALLEELAGSYGAGDVLLLGLAQSFQLEEEAARRLSVPNWSEEHAPLVGAVRAELEAMWTARALLASSGQGQLVALMAETHGEGAPAREVTGTDGTTLLLLKYHSQGWSLGEPFETELEAGEGREYTLELPTAVGRLALVTHLASDQELAVHLIDEAGVSIAAGRSGGGLTSVEAGALEAGTYRIQVFNHGAVRATCEISVLSKPGVRPPR